MAGKMSGQVWFLRIERLECLDAGGASLEDLIEKKKRRAMGNQRQGFVDVVTGPQIR